jgi:hypothetical protein
VPARSVRLVVHEIADERPGRGDDRDGLRRRDAGVIELAQLDAPASSGSEYAPSNVTSTTAFGGYVSSVNMPAPMKYAFL